MDKCVLIRTGAPMPGQTGVTYAAGISAGTAGAHALCLELATLPPGAVAKAHMHTEHESAAYVISGELILQFGERLEQEVVARAGDFLYIPAGVPHRPGNPGSEPAVTVLARTDPHEQESATPLPQLDALVPPSQGNMP